MKKLKVFLGSFRTKVTIAMVVSLVLTVGLSNLLIYKFSLDTQLDQLRERLKIIAQTSTLMIDTDLLLQIPLQRSGINVPAYKAISEKLRRVKEVNPSIKYIYTMTKTGKAGMLQFIVDPNPVFEGRRRRGGSPSAYPGDRYDGSRFPEMLKGFQAPSADKKIMLDEWGVTLSGYAPLRDKSGRVVAMLGVDMAAEDVYLAQIEVHRRAILVLLMGVLLSVALGLLISKRITDRIERLVEGTRHIALDNLEYKVDIRGNDEISELATSFNRMATNLSASRQKLRDYFYRAVQSLVRILEAKDAYTRGHSDRVAEYAGKIGQAMGFSQEKIELLNKAAQLHDIGKLVIHESILNKETPLTEEEWKVIKEHPVIGEEVLKPVLVDEELLNMVRSHHERYDGKGYPDKIKGDSINIFAQIISVADAYDAMVSRRAYREALNKEAAIVELKTNSGTQFNTQVVKAFLKVLEEQR